MKTLFISLMRLGDFLMMRELIRSYKQKNGAEVQVLIYKEFEFAKSLFPFVDHWISIDRKEMQQVAVRKDQYILNNFFELEQLVQKIESENFDKVISLTHNHLSHYFLSALDMEPNRVIGSRVFDSAIDYGSPWIQYLNDIGSFEGVSAFHLIDIYRSALGLNSIETVEDLNLEESTKASIPQEEYICIQMTSNEEKKTFSFGKWKEVIRYYRQLDSKRKILCLCAPDEEANLLSELSDISNLKLEVKACDLVTAQALIHNSRLLVTPDTAIKYLAIGSRTPVLELSLGSSQYNQTGSYTEDSLVLQANLKCSPCSHRLKCPNASFICQDMIGADLVGYTMFHHMEKNWMAIDILASEFFEDVNFYRTEFLQNNFWFASRLGEGALAENLKSMFHQASWQVVLQERNVEDWQRFDLEAQVIRRYLIEKAYTSPENLRPVLEKFEAILLGMELESEELIRSLSPSAKTRKSIGDREKIFQAVNMWFDRNRSLNQDLPAFEQLCIEAIQGEMDTGQHEDSATCRVLDNMNHIIKIERKLSEMIRIDYMEIL
ncbi:MAG: glycosyltransferase family 9 protein [Bdellovibrionota bacterium]|nr:glycosyltransferase family 9 protein [Bdellovibrionota bacterium]